VGILPTRVAKSYNDNLCPIDETLYFKDEITFAYRYDLEKTQASKVIIKEFKSIKL
jgi:hypothetical protein